MSTRLDSEIEFLYNLALADTKTSFQKLVSSATENQIAALVEVAINSDVFFVTPSARVKPHNLVTNPRPNILKRPKSLQTLLRAVLCEIIKCEGIVTSLKENIE